ncbi:DUF4293 domain-containing protein [Litoribacter ruber]|uniref:DUF4293 domain-containing protein n=1 Tax=Litoribacter ruber TaxID=702568 RepID=UPI001BDAF3AA|nr:DUF4293 domain-containing protein [Litoribacter ruber]MBT0812244.1 DUF4293 domain-containing protein [Litoribacter ruber]
MIQRVQTIFLFLLALCMVLVALFPLWSQVNPSQTEQVMLTAWTLTVTTIGVSEISESAGVVSQTTTAYLGFLAVVSGLLALYSLSQFKDRKRQMMLNMINSLIMVIILGATVYLSITANDAIGGRDTGAFMLGFYAIVLAMLMNLLANRFIRKDEMLVRSVDRIR